jgi:glycosyltransferase involved in cell wall biosynthesis
MPIISIVIPIYNQEKYLRKCLDSIVAQTFRDFEVILVDDGSTDSSARICKEYAQRDNRFVYYRKENGGVSAARQFGHDHVRGTYTIHCDPDDWVEPDWLEALHTEAVHTNADITICDFADVNAGNITVNVQRPEILSADAFRRGLFQQLHGSCWNKMIKSSCYNSNGVRFPEGVNYCEDEIFILQLLPYCSVISYVSKMLYYYRRDSINSLSRFISRNGLKDRVNYLKIERIILADEADLINEINEREPRQLISSALICRDLTSKEFREFCVPYRGYIAKSKLPIKRKILLLLATYGPTNIVRRLYMRHLNRLLQ